MLSTLKFKDYTLSTNYKEYDDIAASSFSGGSPVIVRVLTFGKSFNKVVNLFVRIGLITLFFMLKLIVSIWEPLL